MGMIMKKVIFISLLLLSFSAASQFVDLMGSLSVQGTITAASSSSAARGISEIRKQKLLESIRQAAMEIRSQFNGNYDGVGPSHLSEGLFTGMDWYVGQEGYDTFFIQLNEIDTPICRFLLSSPTSAKSIEINGNNQVSECELKNNMKFIFN